MLFTSMHESFPENVLENVSGIIRWENANGLEDFLRLSILSWEEYGQMTNEYLVIRYI